MQKAAIFEVLPDNPLHSKWNPISSLAFQGPYIIWPLPASPISAPFLLSCWALATPAFGFRMSQALLVLKTFVLAVLSYQRLHPVLHRAWAEVRPRGGRGRGGAWERRRGREELAGSQGGGPGSDGPFRRLLELVKFARPALWFLCYRSQDDGERSCIQPHNRGTPHHC